MQSVSSESRVVNTENQSISFILERKKVKNINLRITNDSSIYVSASEDVPVSEIDSFVISRKNYILKHVAEFDCNIAPSSELQYVNGENITLLGRNHRLKIVKSYHESVICDGVYVQINALRLDYKPRIMEQFTEWIESYSRSVFEEVMQNVYRRFACYDLPFPELKIKEMSSRWGSCLPEKETIILNKRLIEAPKFCIEYVLYHEFCHFVYPNHSKKFYSLLQVMLPNWKETKAILEKSVNI